jgi:Flp pilus assembly protein TadD
VDAAADRVERLSELGRLDDAERVARTALAADPQDESLLVALALVLLRGQRYGDGLAAADAAAALAPQHERVHRLRGLLLAGLGRHAEAVEAGYRAVSLAPDEPLAALGYAVVLQRAGRLADAQQVALRAVALDPENPRAHLRVADIAFERGDRRAARRAYVETLRLDPNDATARHDLAVLDLAARRPADALRGLVESGQLDPSMPQVLHNVTVVLWRLAQRLRTVLVVATFALLVVGGPRADADPAALRVAAGVVLVLLTGAVAWTVRDLPAGTTPAVRVALRGDRLLAVACGGLAACTLALAAVAVTGWAGLAVAVWQALLLLSAFVFVLGLVRKIRRRRR